MMPMLKLESKMKLTYWIVSLAMLVGAAALVVKLKFATPQENATEPSGQSRRQITSASQKSTNGSSGQTAETKLDSLAIYLNSKEFLSKSSPTSAETTTAPESVDNPEQTKHALEKPKTGRENLLTETIEPTEVVDLARLALSTVGTDPVAELFWYDAINDPSLTAKQRKDLIEDLNEDSFPDPKNITQTDLPLIMSRMELIEEIAADAMDETNAAAFAEAYKDLTKLLYKLTQESKAQ